LDAGFWFVDNLPEPLKCGIGLDPTVPEIAARIGTADVSGFASAGTRHAHTIKVMGIRTVNTGLEALELANKGFRALTVWFSTQAPLNRLRVRTEDQVTALKKSLSNHVALAGPPNIAQVLVGQNYEILAGEARVARQEITYLLLIHDRRHGANLEGGPRKRRVLSL
jgi:hypothetical protein